ncbi:MAG: hypothetical protein WDW36_002603 [Sanguina aurantia]
MSYAPFFRNSAWSFPAGTAAFIVGYAYIQMYQGKPAFGTKELSKAEFVATPVAYLQSPDMHPQALPKVPGTKNVPDALGELMHKAHPHH